MFRHRDEVAAPTPAETAAMRSTRLSRAGLLALLALLILPSLAFGQDDALNVDEAVPKAITELNVTWVLVATVLVFFMQAGFALLEIGFSRGKNAGMGIAKILVNFSIASIVWWAVGFGIAFGGAGWLAGDSGWLFQFGRDVAGEGASGETASFFIFQFMFAAVSLAIVWGTTLERMKFAAYVPFAIDFSAVIYPLIAHWASAAASSPPTASSARACRTSRAPRSCTSPAPPRRWRRCSSSGRARASTAPTASRGRSPATTCRCSASAC